MLESVGRLGLSKDDPLLCLGDEKIIDGIDDA